MPCKPSPTAHSLRRDGQRVIYTSPLKALSNQKYRELAEEFRDVGEPWRLLETAKLLGLPVDLCRAASTPVACISASLMLLIVR